MSDYRTLFDRDYIGAWDLPGDVTVVITDVKAGEIVGQNGRKAKKPIVRFEGKEKALLCNKTNAKTIAGLYGNDTAAWIGKKVTLYPTQTQMGGETMDCIRVRQTIPTGRPRASNKAAPPEPPNGQASPSLEEHDAYEPS